MFLAGGGVQAGHQPGRLRRAGLLRGGEEAARPRLAGDDAAPVRLRSREADTRFQGRDFRLTDVHGRWCARSWLDRRGTGGLQRSFGWSRNSPSWRTVRADARHGCPIDSVPGSPDCSSSPPPPRTCCTWHRAARSTSRRTRHYWDWSRHLDWSYYSKGPLVAWLIRGSHVVGALVRARHRQPDVRRPPARRRLRQPALTSLYVLTVQVFGRPRPRWRWSPVG